MTTPQIAERLLVSSETVKSHFSHVFAKLGASRGSQVATLAADHLRNTGGTDGVHGATDHRGVQIL